MTLPPGPPWPPQHGPGSTPYGAPHQGHSGGHPQWPAPPPTIWQPLPPNKGGKKKWVLAGAAVAVVVAIAAAGTVILRSDEQPESEPVAQPTSSVPATPSVDNGVPVTALPGLVLTPDELNGALGTSEMEAVSHSTNFQPRNTSRPECGGVVDTGMRVAYEGSGYRALQFQFNQDDGEHAYNPREHVFGVPQVRLSQMVTAFPDSARADKFAADEAGKWRQCVGAGVVTLFQEGEPNVDYRVSEVKQNAEYTVQGVLTVDLRRAGDPNTPDMLWTCFHSLGAQRNIVADVMICDSYLKHNKSAKLVERILSKVPAK